MHVNKTQTNGFFLKSYPYTVYKVHVNKTQTFNFDIAMLY